MDFRGIFNNRWNLRLEEVGYLLSVPHCNRVPLMAALLRKEYPRNRR